MKKITWLILASVFVFLPMGHVLGAILNNSNDYLPFYPTTNTNAYFSEYSPYTQYLNALKPYKKGFDESLKPGVSLSNVALTLLKPNLTFEDIEKLFKKSVSANPDCYFQGGTYSYPPGSVTSALVCFDLPKDGCHSCACKCQYQGWLWDSSTNYCGCPSKLY